MDRPRPAIVEHFRSRDPGARLEALAGDASTRSFVRVRARGGTVVVMDYGSPFAGETDDIRMERIFRRAGLPVARLLETHTEAGFLVLEDLGDVTLEQRLRGCAASPEPPALLRQAVELAAAVAERGTPALAAAGPGTGPALDAERFRFEMDFFLEHYVGTLKGVEPLPEELRTELHALADRASETPRRVFCHRDFHSRNLMVLPGGGLAMLDIQDARWGPDSYDLASLLRDGYVEMGDGWLAPLIDRYLGALARPPDRDGFRRRFDRVSAQRMLKALGTFAYQAAVLGRSRFLEPIPRTIRRLETLFPAVPEARRLAELLEALALFRTGDLTGP